MRPLPQFFFFFNDTATTEIYTLSLHDALPISRLRCKLPRALETRTKSVANPDRQGLLLRLVGPEDRKSTRLNSSHVRISYAVFCLKKKNAVPQRPTALPSEVLQPGRGPIPGQH